MRVSGNYFLSAVLRAVAAITLLAGMAGILSSTALGQCPSAPLTPWTAIGASGTVIAGKQIVKFTVPGVSLLPGTTGTVGMQYLVAATGGFSGLPATTSAVTVRFRSSDNTGTVARVSFDIHATSILSGGNIVVYHFDSNGKASGASFVTFCETVGLDFDFSQNVYWIEANIFRSDAAQFADLEFFQIWEI
jgi:hypothetical protein